MSTATLPSDVDRLVEHLFRHEAGRLAAMLTRLFGTAHLDLAEEIAQDALVEALERWPDQGVPEQPAAWLTAVAKNRALNALKHSRMLAAKADQLSRALDAEGTAGAAAAPTGAGDLVRLLFVASHPALPPESRIALTLKTVCGLTIEQIAAALLSRPEAIAQRVVRAKRQIRALALEFELQPMELPGRLDAVLECLYLLFNEGYSASDGDQLVREELCDEAIRLCTLLADGDAPYASARVDALLALMLLQAARLPARTGAHGELVPLERQDRARWDRSRLLDGLRRLARSARGADLTTYHLEAGIAAAHAVASSVAETDWRHVLELYDALLRLHPSPVAALNRAVAVAHCDGPAAALESLEQVRSEPALQRYHLLWATLAHLNAELGDRGRARDHYRTALTCPCSAPERRFLERALAEVGDDAGPAPVA